MPGLDRSIVRKLNAERALARVRFDMKSDLILAPHYQAIFDEVGEDLWEELTASLSSGGYQARLPVTAEMPKDTGITRPVSILPPMDRVLYQALADLLAPFVEQQLNRSVVFSCILQDPDPENQMFAHHSECWEHLREAIRERAECGRWTHVVKADICSYYERIRQHSLINQLRASGGPSGAIALLEEVLLAWTERHSHGLLQGLLPSDLLGNFHLVTLDAELEADGISHLRFMDDLFAFFATRRDAERGMVELCRCLRLEGLTLNALKSSILCPADLIREETELDTQFQEARREIVEERFDECLTFYGLQMVWTADEPALPEEEVRLQAVEALWSQAGEPGAPADKIRRFCLPALGAAGSEVALMDALAGISERPHLSQLYSRYLWHLGRRNPDVRRELEAVLQRDEFICDWQAMWPIAAVYFTDSVAERTVKVVMRLLRDKGHAECLRALCALFVGKHGDVAQKQTLRHQYGSEPSEYVRSAILFAAQYFSSPERRACVKAWKGHSAVNELVASAMQRARTSS